MLSNMLHRIQLHFQQQALDNSAMSSYLMIHSEAHFTQMTRHVCKHEDGTPSSFQIHIGIYDIQTQCARIWHVIAVCWLEYLSAQAPS